VQPSKAKAEEPGRCRVVAPHVVEFVDHRLERVPEVADHAADGLERTFGALDVAVPIRTGVGEGTEIARADDAERPRVGDLKGLERGLEQTVEMFHLISIASGLSGGLDGFAQFLLLLSDVLTEFHDIISSRVESGSYRTLPTWEPGCIGN